MLKMLQSFFLSVIVLTVSIYWEVNATGHAKVSIFPDQMQEEEDVQNLEEILNVTLPVEGKDVQLNLHRNTNFDDVPVLLGNRKTMEHWKGEEKDKFAVYVDLEHQASILVKSRQLSNGKYKKDFKGSFTVDDQDYMVEPMKEQENGRVKRAATSDTPEDEDLYVTYEVNRDDALAFETDAIIREPVRVSKEFNDEKKKFSQDEEPKIKDGMQHYTVEVLICADFALYEKFLMISPQRSLRGRELDAIAQLRYYIVHIANGMDLRYRSMNTADFQINIKLSGIYIARTYQDSPWTEYNKEYEQGNPRAFTDAYTALDDFENWINDNENNLPRFDQATLFTGTILYSPKSPRSTTSGDKKRGIAGLADIDGVCTRYRASVNQDQGLYASTQTATHELGHNLGAYHDGSSNPCQTSHQYIMSTSPGVLNSNNYLNPYRFSDCSIKYFREHMNYLNSEQKNCLLESANNFNYTEFTLYLSMLPGQIYSLDEQCKYALGPRSYYCGGHYSDKRVCAQMVCWNPLLNKCISSVEQKAANGTTCGNKQWCLYGRCVSDAKAPPALEYCRTGDFKGKVYDSKFCRDWVYEEPYMCYVNETRDYCCKSCADIERPSTDCPYGDKSVWCKNARLTAHECYTHSDLCCESCKPQRTAIVGCEFGDKASWCRDIEPHICYASEDICCQACIRLETGLSGCEYGDRATWCAREMSSRKSCYLNSATCCGTCRKFATGLEGCKYGDHRDDCYNLNCEDRNIWRDCCHTCHSTIMSYTTTKRYIQPKLPPTTIEMKTPTPISSRELRDKATWCSTMPRRDCYVNEEICQLRCKSLYGNIPNCEYGDYFSWCYLATEIDCEDPNYYRDCCEHCRTLIGIKPPKIETPSTTVSSVSPSVSMTGTPSTHTKTPKPLDPTSPGSRITARTTSTNTPGSHNDNADQSTLLVMHGTTLDPSMSTTSEEQLPRSSTPTAPSSHAVSSDPRSTKSSAKTTPSSSSTMSSTSASPSTRPTPPTSKKSITPTMTISTITTTTSTMETPATRPTANPTRRTSTSTVTRLTTKQPTTEQSATATSSLPTTTTMKSMSTSSIRPNGTNSSSLSPGIESSYRWFPTKKRAAFYEQWYSSWWDYHNKNWLPTSQKFNMHGFV